MTSPTCAPAHNSTIPDWCAVILSNGDEHIIYRAPPHARARQGKNPPRINNAIHDLLEDCQAVIYNARREEGKGRLWPAPMFAEVLYAVEYTGDRHDKITLRIDDTMHVIFGFVRVAGWRRIPQ